MSSVRKKKLGKIFECNFKLNLRNINWPLVFSVSQRKHILPAQLHVRAHITQSASGPWKYFSIRSSLQVVRTPSCYLLPVTLKMIEILSRFFRGFSKAGFSFITFSVTDKRRMNTTILPLTPSSNFLSVPQNKKPRKPRDMIFILISVIL